MEKEKLKEFALFKFSLIAPIVNDTYSAVSQMQYLRDIASKTHVLPNGKSVYFSPSTIKKWLINYNKGGFDALIPKVRSDAGVPRVLSNAVIARIYEIKEQFPYITGKLVYQKLIEEGTLLKKKASLSSVLRFIKDNNLKKNQLLPVERKAYEMEFANDCWQADTSHGAVITVNGQKRQTYLICTIDDTSRLITHGEFFFNDNAVNLQSVFKKAISKYGIPKKFFVDNGPSYRNEQLRLICASLGVILIYTKAYSPQSKGKIERVFRTIKDNWLNAVDWNRFDSLESLNSAFNRYLNEKYININHSSLEMSPRERFLKDSNKIKYIPKETLDNHFLHRSSRKVNNDATIQINNKLFEVPQKYIGQRVNIRHSPHDFSVAYLFDEKGSITDTVYPVKKVDNSKIKRNVVDYTKILGGDNNV